LNVYVFGNEYVAEDKEALEVTRELEGAIAGISFVFVGPNEDVPFVDERYVVVLDTVERLQDVALVGGGRIDELISSVALDLRYGVYMTMFRSGMPSYTEQFQVLPQGLQ
jgi:hypothetical protein